MEVNFEAQGAEEDILAKEGESNRRLQKIVWGASWFILLTKYYLIDYIKECVKDQSTDTREGE
jgi:hypothetical protein